MYYSSSGNAGKPKAVAQGGNDSQQSRLMVTKPASLLAWLLLSAVCVLSLVLLASRIHEGFIPWDDPLLAHAAERVLQGQLPNVDFHDPYTGGLTYLGGLAFRLFGTNLLAPRIMLLIFFAAWVPAVWYIASRFANAFAASCVTMLAVVWSVPLYPSPIASWYNLYFATFGAVALLRYIDVGSKRWIFVSGLSAGLSILCKISGLYFAAAALLFLIFEEQSDRPHRDGESRVRITPYLLALALTLLAFTAVVFLLVSRHGSAAEYYNFALPAAVISILLVTRECRLRWVPLRFRLRRLGLSVAPFVGGLLVPIAVFLVPYLRSGGVAKWATDVFVLSFTRVQANFYPAINPVGALLGLPLFGLFWVNHRVRNLSGRRTLASALYILSGAIILFALRHPGFARWIWVSVATSIPLLVIVSAQAASRSPSSGPRKRTSEIALLAMVTAICSLIQFPFSGPMYFCYVAPLVILTATALISRESEHLRPSFAAPVLLFLFLFAILILMPSQIYDRGMSLHPMALKRFSMPRAGGILGESDTVDTYERLSTEVSRHAGPGPIYAGPDSAGLYFLTGHQNPTPILGEFLSGKDTQASRVISALDRSHARLAIINHEPGNNSGPLSPDLLDALRSRFPESEMIDKFEVRWGNQP